MRPDGLQDFYAHIAMRSISKFLNYSEQMVSHDREQPVGEYIPPIHTGLARRK
jgi:hypothetical protein